MKIFVQFILPVSQGIKHIILDSQNKLDSVYTDLVRVYSDQLSLFDSDVAFLLILGVPYKLL